MKKVKVVILGGGPSSVFAWYGARQVYSYDEVQIWANEPEVAYPPGAFWLHDIPPCNLNFQSEDMYVRLMGSGEGYSRKQWGEVYPTSADQYKQEVKVRAWNPQVVLPILWKACNVRTTARKFTSIDIMDIAAKYDHVIQTFPTDPLSIDLMRKNRYPTYYSQLKDLKRNTCVYQGRADIPWVRLTMAFGWVSLEFPSSFTDTESILENCDGDWGGGGKVVTTADLHPTQKPVIQTVYGPKRNVLLTGRWATLDRKALSHHSYDQVKKFLEDANNG